MAKMKAKQRIENAAKTAIKYGVPSQLVKFLLVDAFATVEEDYEELDNVLESFSYAIESQFSVKVAF